MKDGLVLIAESEETLLFRDTEFHPDRAMAFSWPEGQVEGTGYVFLSSVFCWLRTV